MDLIYLFLGLIIGIIASWFIAKYKFQSLDKGSLNNLENLKKENEDILRKNIVLEEKVKNIAILKTEINEKEQHIIKLTANISAKDADIKNIKERLEENKKEIEKVQDKFRIEFKNLANEILEEKTKKFTEQNKTNISEILKPLNEKIKDFEKKVEDTYEKGLRDRTEMQTELKKLHELNSRISEEAHNLTKALKGDVKKQGNWGEVVLERILESSGLIKGEEYETQYSTENDDGKRIQPDVIIFLPDKKHIIIDSKVSLVAYEQFVNAETEEERVQHIKEHIRSVKNHVKELSDKKYQTSVDLNTPEYVLMFIPIESSFSVTIQEDNEIFNYAWSNKIVIVSPSTLIATLMTISSVWKQENQTKNAIEIARQSGALYDKFEGFVNDLKKIGKTIQVADDTYQAAMNKLSTGKGNLIGRAERIKELGAKATKSLPDNLIEEKDDAPKLEFE